MLTSPAVFSAAQRPATGPGISRLQGQQLARRELARSMYRPSVLSRLWHDFVTWLDSLTVSGSAGRPSWLGAAVLTAAILIALAAVLYFAGPARLNRHSGRPVVEGRPRSAAEYRLTADALAASGDYAAAIVERVRAVAVDLELRQVLAPKPGRTAAELAAETGLAVPAEAAALASAARLFDDVRYGGRTGSQPGYQQVRDLDLRIMAVPIRVSAEPGPGGRVPAGLPPAGILLGSDGHPDGALR
jgi:Domain of unknown function (DUF4129)